MVFENNVPQPRGQVEGGLLRTQGGHYRKLETHKRVQVPGRHGVARGMQRSGEHSGSCKSGEAPGYFSSTGKARRLRLREDKYQWSVGYKIGPKD